MTILLERLDQVPGDKIAVIDDDESLTYDELRFEARQIANYIETRYGRGGYVVLRAKPTARFVGTMLGVMLSGNAPIPIAADLPEEDLEYIRTKSNAIAVLDPLAKEEFSDCSESDFRDDQRPALVLFTSGTTGYPKGVVISHANLAHACRAIAGYLDYEQFASAAVVLPLHYSYALLSQVCCQLFVGGRIRLFSGLRNPIKFARIVDQLGLETFCGVPSTYLALTTVHSMSKLCMPSVRVLCSAGAAMNRGTFDTVKQIFPNATFFNNYGMTEAAPRISYIADTDPRFYEPTCGRPMEGVEVRIVDPLTHQQLPDGQQGMLVVRGPNVTDCYLNDPELTARSFTPDGFLISGDVAYMEDGLIFICGRNDDMFNVAGEKVAPLEIERVLNKLRAVDASAVVGLPDEQRGMVPVAFLKLAETITRRQIVESLDGHLPAIKIPQRYLEVSNFPTTPNGKLQRKALSTDDSEYVVREIV